MAQRYAAVILAAGASTRMGALGPKALLRTAEGDTFLERAVARCHEAGADPILVVTGAHPLAPPPPARAVTNPEWPRGQLSSLQAGLAALAGIDVDAIIVALVDHPFVTASTFSALLLAFETSRPLLVRPVHAGRRGHPIVVASALFDELRAAPPDEGARPVYARHADRALDVAVDDPGVLADLDTPEDLPAR